MQEWVEDDTGFFFFNDTATTEIYTLSLHDALPIFELGNRPRLDGEDVLRDHLSSRSSARSWTTTSAPRRRSADRKSTRLNSSHANISYAVFCLKKKHHHTYPVSTLRHTAGAHIPAH